MNGFWKVQLGLLCAALLMAAGSAGADEVIQVSQSDARLAVFLPKGMILTDAPAPRGRRPVAEGHAGPRFEAVLINGGGRPRVNYQSHLLHIRALLDLLKRCGVGSENITVFNADGSDPQPDLAVRDVQRERAFWLLKGTRLERHLRKQVRYQDSHIEGMDLRPATPEALAEWFEEAPNRLRPGDTLLLYVTDHGTKNRDDVSNNRITLWGEKVSVSVEELRAMLAHLDPGVRVVSLMSQCYSGAFANLMDSADGLPGGNVCGYFASTAERPAYGCYPENRDKDNVGHSFRFIDALGATASFLAAHDRVMTSDRTPDVPLRTTDVYLQRVLDETAEQRGVPRNQLADELLRRAWRDKARWEPEIRLLDRIGQAFGYFSPRSLSELEQQSTLLPEISDKFDAYKRAWGLALDSLASENLERFLNQQPDWSDRLTNEALNGITPEQRHTLTHDLLADLMAYTRADAATWQRLQLLKNKADRAGAAAYRMQVRLGVVLRMETVLSSIAGRVLLEEQNDGPRTTALQKLIECEDFSLTMAGTGEEHLVIPQPFPSYDQELQLAEEVLPGWMGIRFRQASEERRDRDDLADGAVMVVAVFPDSPASAAGLEVGDIVLGPPNQPFDEERRIREWIMTAPLGVPQTLVVRRGDAPMEVTLRPAPFPLKWPELPGPPESGSPAPPLGGVEPYRGTVPDKLAEGGPYLLFFWATWCAPCKAAVPELLAYETKTATRVIAITDELPETLETFFATYNKPFFEHIAWDEVRRSFLAYGVSGTPGFVLIDASGTVQKTWTGYNVSKGLDIEGWEWKQ